MRVLTAICLAGVVACSFASVGVRGRVGSLITTAWNQVRGLTEPRRVRETLLGPGDQLSISGKSVTVIRISPEEMSERLAWSGTVEVVDGWLVFHGETLKQAADVFNRYNPRQLIVRDPAAAGLRIGGKFRVSDIDGFLAALEVTHGVRVERGSEVSGQQGAEAITLLAPVAPPGDAPGSGEGEMGWAEPRTK